MKGVPKLLLNEHLEDETGVYGTEFDNVSRRPFRVFFEWHFYEIVKTPFFAQISSLFDLFVVGH